MDGVVREIYTRLYGRGLSLVKAGDREWKLNQLLFVDDTASVCFGQSVVTYSKMVPSWTKFFYS